MGTIKNGNIWGGSAIAGNPAKGIAMNGATIHKAGESSDQPVVISTTLSENSWETIAAVSEAGNAPLYWNNAISNTANEKSIQLTTGETLTLKIIAFGHDDKASGEKAGITFGTKNLMAAERAINTSGLNTTGYFDSELHQWLSGELYDALPADLRAIIKPVIKKASIGGASTTIESRTVNISLFSEIEITNGLEMSMAGEGTWYSIFSDRSSRIRYLSNGTGTSTAWWLRSPRSVNTLSFCLIDSDGVSGGHAAQNSHGVCFGLCV